MEGVPIRNVALGPAIQDVARAKTLASPRDVAFRDPAHFVAGGLRRNAHRWKSLPNADPLILSFVVNGVDAWSFISHFKGKFGKETYDSPSPPQRAFLNNKTCAGFETFITETILERVANGSLQFWGLEGQVEPPHLVMPITVEPTKPRMCHDERFLNLWIKDCPFTLDYLSDLPRYVGHNSFQTVCDDKSGYDHISLTAESRTLFGLSWKGCYFVYCTVPFGWKASAYIYQSVGLVASSHIRSLGVPCSQYIDDRHIGQLETPSDCCWSDLQKAEAAAYIVTATLTALGYTIGLSKSSLVPSRVVRYLGYLCDSQRRAFILPQDKKEKFRTLRETILSQQETDLKSLQRFAGKTTSFSIAVPAARLYTRACYRTIGHACKTPARPIRVSGELREEISYWRFLDSWNSHLPWFEERHKVVSCFTDASNSGWGAILLVDAVESRRLRDYWGREDQEKPIVIREALALQQALRTMGSDLKNCRVDAHVDSLPVVLAWRNQGGRSKNLSEAIKSIHETALSFNIALALSYVPSSKNPADQPSRSLSPNDCKLGLLAWNQVEERWGPHTIDLMALDSNAQRGPNGLPLPHYTPWPTEFSAGVNVFAQSISSESNAYVLPPLVLVGPLVRYFLSMSTYRVTVVIPDVRPRRFWWPILSKRASESLKLGNKGDEELVYFPIAGKGFTSKPLPWDLWAFRL